MNEDSSSDTAPRFHPEPVGPSYLTDEQRQAIRELGFPRGATMIQAADGDTEAEQIRSWAKTIGIEPTDWQVRAAAAIMRGEQVSWPKAAGRRTVARILEAGNTEETNS